MMVLTNQPIVALVVSLFLSGCTGSTYSTHFDCPMGEGAGCASISKVNKMIDRQEIDLGNDDVPVAKGICVSKLPRNQVYVYYGPDQLSRLISIDGQEGN
jgi:conjugal transfer pilus assembly protein TraV